MIAVLAGNPSVDRLHSVEVLRPGQIHRPSSVVMLPGGKGINVARAIVALGGDAHVLGILGGHSGSWIAEAAAREGIRGTFAWSSSETRTSISVAQSARPGEPLTEFYEPAPPVAAEVWSELEARVAEVVAGASLLCVCGGLIAGAPLAAYNRAVDLAHAAGRAVAIDSHGDAFAAALKAGPELVKVNALEAAEALGLESPERDDDALAWATAAAAALRDLAGGRGACIVTCGADGMALVDEAGARYQGFLPEAGPYSVGSGDAAFAAIALAREGGEPWPAALRAAIGAGAANACVPGPGLLDPRESRELAARATIRRLAT